MSRIAEEIRAAVNAKYTFLRIALDGIFKTLLLLKKKKYAALKVLGQAKSGAGVELKRETKGLDQVRRDWWVTRPPLSCLTALPQVPGKPAPGERRTQPHPERAA